MLFRSLCAADLYLGAIQELAIVGDPESSETQALLIAARAPYLPNLLVMLAHTGEDATRFPLIEGKPQIGGRATAYLCQDYACKQPVTDPADLIRLLDGQLGSPLSAQTETPGDNPPGV